MKIQQFNGGLNTRLAPQMLELNQGVEFSNIDIATGTLTPLKDKLATTITTEQYAEYYDAGDEWISSSVPTEYLEFQGKLYWTDGGVPKKYFNGEEDRLGIVRPTSKVNLSGQSVINPLTEFTTENLISTGGNLPYGDLDYLIVNERDGIQAAPFEYTVYASSTASARASGEIIDLDFLGYYNLKTRKRSNSITTLIGNNRSVRFSAFKGQLGDAASIYRRYNDIWYKVGEITSLSGVVVDDVEDISANDELNLDEFSAFNSTYQYVYTYYNINDGTESAPSPVSDELEIDSGVIQVSNIRASSDSQVTNIKLYRVGSNITEFSLVAQLNNVNQTYLDELKDSEIVGDLLESDNYYEAPTGLRFLSESYAMLFGAIGPSLRFTPIGRPNAWPPEYVIEFDANITGIGAVANGILVMTRTATYIVTGTGPLSLAQQPLRGDQGCISFSSIQEVTKGMICWASADGLCVSSGNNVEVITKNLLGKINLSPVSSAVVDEVYYCLNSDGTTLVWDFRFSPTFYNLNLGVSQLSVAQSELYGWEAGTQHLMFQGENSLEYLYKSPRYTEGSLTLPKTYKKFYFSHNGDIIINILINDLPVVTNKALTGKDVTEVMVPQDKQRGEYVQFEISGTGELLEIEYTASVNRSG